MERIHKLKWYDFCVAKICFRKVGKIVSYGTVVVTDILEFAGHMNGDTIIGFFQNGKFYVVYHVETINLIKTSRILDYSIVEQISYDYKFEMLPIDQNFFGNKYTSFDKMFSIEFEQEQTIDELEAMEILKRNGDLFTRG